jgi:hypothetical protein
MLLFANGLKYHTIVYKNTIDLGVVWTLNELQSTTTTTTGRLTIDILKTIVEMEISAWICIRISSAENCNVYD